MLGAMKQIMLTFAAGLMATAASAIEPKVLDVKVEQSDKAQIGFLLAKNYHRAGRYEAARTEYLSVLNQFPKTDAAVE